MNQQPACTIKPDMDAEKYRTKYRQRGKKDQTQTCQNTACLQSFVLLLSWRMDVDCNEPQILVSQGRRLWLVCGIFSSAKK